MATGGCRWAYGVGADSLLALGWVPLFVLAHLLIAGGGPAADHRASVLLAATLLFSLVHQPLTLGLVYLDPQTRAQQRRVAGVAPLIAVAVVGAAVYAGWWWAVVPVAAGWNLVHTVHQRYGILRVYGRKSGYGVARLDRAFVYVTLLCALVIGTATSRISDQLRRVDLDRTVHDGIAQLQRLHGTAAVLVVPVLAGTAWVVARTVAEERRAGPDANPARWLYLVSVAALAVAIAVDPIAGFVGYVAGHAIEYFVVVDRTLVKRGHHRPGAMLAGAAVVLTALFAGLQRTLPFAAYDTGVFTIGVLHFWFDGRIWKLRRPAVAAQFGITGAGVSPPLRPAAP